MKCTCNASSRTSATDYIHDYDCLISKMGRWKKEKEEREKNESSRKRSCNI